MIIYLFIYILIWYNNLQSVVLAKFMNQMWLIKIEEMFKQRML